MKIPKIVILTLFIIILQSISVIAIDGCYIDTSCDAGYEVTGAVSRAGHYTTDASSNYAYKLCCPTSWGVGEGDVAFTYSTDSTTSTDGGNHVGSPSNTNFYGQVALGTHLSCQTTQESCGTDRACVFKTSQIDNGHIADCTEDIPGENNYEYSLCCEIQELCSNGIDDDQDGFIDCADSSCQGPIPLTEADSCTGNFQQSEYCLLNPSACEGSNGETYYCSPTTDTQGQDIGFCCPAGTFASQNPFGTGYVCVEAGECGVGTDYACKYDVRYRAEDWAQSVYTGNAGDWCNSQVPYLYTGFLQGEYSTGCCQLTIYGEQGYFLHQDNVQIWGWELETPAEDQEAQ